MKEEKGLRANNLRAYIKDGPCGTFDQVALITGINVRTLRRYASGETMPTVENAIKIARCLRLDVEDIFDRPYDPYIFDGVWNDEGMMLFGDPRGPILPKNDFL